jgi:nitronate monooxygenase
VSALWGLCEHPIALAPMGGGPGTPALAAAVSDAGGLGFLAGGYRSAAQLDADIAATRALTDRPFGVNLFVAKPATEDLRIVEYVATLQGEAERYGVELGAPTYDDDGYFAKLDLLVEARVAVASFTFAPPARRVVERLRAVGTRVVTTVTSPGEAAAAAAEGVDGLCLQGFEAGGHRGSWDDARDGHDDTGLLALVAAARDLPVEKIAAGGLMDGRDVAAVLVAGADTAQLGTAFLACPEAGTHPTYRDALVAPPSPTTAITRAFSGRRARGIVNRFMVEHAGAPSGYPQINNATRALRRAAAEAGDAGAMSLWAGQGFARVRPMPAGELVARLARECVDALGGH